MTETNIGNNLEEIRKLLDLEQPAQLLGTDFAWYVGATGKNEEGIYTDFSDQFIDEGCWKNGWDTKFVDLVKTIQVGDKMALKSSYTRKHNLPFNNNGKVVGVMGIKAIGTVTKNPGDGKNLEVDWQRVTPVKEWYGKGVLRSTVHLVKAEDGLTKKLLLQFTFGNVKQDYSLCEEQYADDPDEKSIEEQLVNELEETHYSIEELGRLLSDMYTSPETINKTTAIHMFGIKYGKYILEKGYPVTSIIDASGINESYHVELSKGIRIYSSILNNEYGISFYDGTESNKRGNDKYTFPTRTPRTDKKHELNTIIFGPPGTGKTFSTMEYALAMIDSVDVDLSRKDEQERKKVMTRYNDLVKRGRIVFTTFHQNYGYEDFVQGLRPDTNTGGISFKNVDGVLKKMAERAINDYENNYVIIIDEINRANISKVFGELITLIEDDKRWGEINQTSVTLPSGEFFAIPNNLFILGTMNSSDKSISLIDAALRRRFVFIEQKPDEKMIDDKILREVFNRINSRLVNDLDSTDLLIGHSYFMNKGEGDLIDILNHNIIPLLYEYFFDNRKRVAGVLGDVLKDIKITVVDERNGRICVREKESDGDNN